MPDEASSPRRGRCRSVICLRGATGHPLAVAAIGISGACHDLPAGLDEVPPWSSALVYAFALYPGGLLLASRSGSGLRARTAHRPGSSRTSPSSTSHGLAVLGGYVLMTSYGALRCWCASSGMTPSAVFWIEFLVCAAVVLLPTFFMGISSRPHRRLRRAPEGRRDRRSGVQRQHAGVDPRSFLGGFVCIRSWVQWTWRPW